MATQRGSNIKKLWPDYEVSDADLNQPTTEFVMAFLERCLDELALLEFSLEDRSSEQVLNPASIADGSRKMVICSIFRLIFAKIKGTQFGIEDIMEPDPRRFGRQIDMLLHLVQYLDFYFSKRFDEVMEDIDRQSQLKESSIRETDELKEKRNQIAMEIKELNTDFKSKLDDKAKYAVIVGKVKGKELEMSAEYNKHKAIHEKLGAEISAMEEAIRKGNEEIEEIKGNIILSPDSVSRERVELMNRRKELMERQASLKSTAEEKNQFAMQIEQLYSKMEGIPLKIKELAESYSFSRHLEKGFHEDELNCKKATEKVEAAKKDYENTKLSLIKFQEQIAKLTEEHAANVAFFENEIIEKNRCLQEAEAEHLKKGAEQVLAAQEIHIWKEKLTSLEEDKKLLEKLFLEEVQIIENAVDEVQWKFIGKVEQVERRL